jgi:hypothetical protein
MRSLGLTILAISTSLYIVGCGNDSGGDSGLGNSLNGLQSIPSVSSLVKANGSASSAGVINGLGNGLSAIGLQAVSGTPPTMLALSQSSTLVDQAFFNGVVSAINTAQTATAAQADQYWKGQGACWLGQSAAEGIGRLIQTGTSMCYMREIPKVSGAVTITSGSLDSVSNIFNQSATDRLVKIAVSGDGENEDVFIRVYGTNTTGANVYRVNLYFCTNGSVTGSESMEVNKSTGVYTTSGSQSRDSQYGSYAVSAYLSAANGTVSFDASKERTMTAAFSGSWGNFKGSVTITGGNVMRTKRYNSFTHQSTSGIDKNYSVASFTGTGISTLRFLDGASKGHSTWGGEGHGYSVGTEYRDTRYVDTASGDKYVEAAAVDFSSDSFYTSSLTVTAPTFTEDCNATPDIAASLNMSSAGMATVQATCEADRFDNYSMCNSSTMQSAQNYIFASQSY